MSALDYTTMGLTILAQAEKTGPRGEEFGKASPVGLFVILGLLVVVLFIGFSMNKRIRRMERRRAFADEHGIDIFDREELQRRMNEAGYTETTRSGTLFARTEVPVTDERFQPSSGVLTGPDAIDHEKHLQSRKETSNSGAGNPGAVDPGATDATDDPR